MQRIEQLRETIAAKQAYGVKTTRLENELYRLERAALPAWRRITGDVFRTVFLWSSAVVLWGLLLSPVWFMLFRR